MILPYFFCILGVSRRSGEDPYLGDNAFADFANMSLASGNCDFTRESSGDIYILRLVRCK